MRSPLQQSLKKLRSEGWEAEKVEQPWNPYTKRTQDLYNFGDILAFKDDVTLICQTTSGSNVSARLLKIDSNPIAKKWIASQYRLIVVHGWARRGPRGKRKLWTCREVYYAVDAPAF